MHNVRRSWTPKVLLTLFRARSTTVTLSLSVSLRTFWTDCMQSVLNAAARLISANKSEHFIPLLRELHVPERIRFPLCVVAFRCLHGTAPSRLADGLRRASTIVVMLVLPIPSRFSDSVQHWVTVFQAAASRAWNCLPSTVKTSV